jgi:hypothetical protein
MTYEENQALEWMDAVFVSIPWGDVAPDSEGEPMERIMSAYINTQDTYAEGVISIREQPEFLRRSLDCPEAEAMLPPMPKWGE